MTAPPDRNRRSLADLGEVGNAPTAPAFHLGYRRWLDGLRGLAILLVLAGHLKLIPGGFLGVDVFFVLSGFLITNLLVEEWQRRRSIHLGRFYLRRGLRLLPAFFALLLAGYLGTWLFRPADLTTFRKEMVVAACYVANWPRLHQTDMPTLGHTWSLSLEEQFYLLWPVLLYGMLRLGASRRQIILLVCAGIVASAALRVGLYRCHRGAGAEKMALLARLYCGLDTRADALLVGCLAALLAGWGLLPSSRRFRRGASAAALLAVAALGYLVWNKCFEHCQLYYGLFTVVAGLVAIVLVDLLSGPSPFASLLLESRPLVGVGRLSYALYLFHVPIIHWLRPADLGWAFPVETVGVTGLSFAAAVLSYWCIERPCLRLKQLLRPPA
jgi:peptidoglycan/LPS O-acetylase OafA/YrhL